jgi:hypothetical protein
MLLSIYIPVYNILENRRSARRTGHTSRYMQRHTNKQKRPPPQLLTFLRQRLEIKALPDGHPPPTQEHLVHAHAVRPRARPHFVGDRVCRNGGEGVVPVPADGLLGRLDAAGGADGAVWEGGGLGEGEVLVGGEPAGADEEDVSWLEGGVVLVGGDGEELGEGDAGAGEGVDGDVVGLGPGEPVEEDAPAGDGLFCYVFWT